MTGEETIIEYLKSVRGKMKSIESISTETKVMGSQHIIDELVGRGIVGKKMVTRERVVYFLKTQDHQNKEQ